MEKAVSFRFYKIGRKQKDIPQFADALWEIEKIQKRCDREREIRPDCTIRLEELEKDGPGVTVGEIVRVQKTNMPSEVHATGRSPLTTANPLGHGVTFRFNSNSSTLCIQHEPRIASAGRLLDYISDCWPEAVYEIKPLIKPKTWERFNSGDVRKIAIKIAQPELLGQVAGHKAAAVGMHDMAEAYEAPAISVELSMGTKRSGHLNEKVKGLAKSFLHACSGNKTTSPQMMSLKAVTYIDDAREELDLIEERLKVRETLELDDRDPEKNYKVKKLFLRKLMNEQGL